MTVSGHDATTSSGGPGGGIRVLVVEDSIDHQMLMVRRLRQHGMEVTAASNATEALAMVGDVELVLLDYRLPGTSGIEVLAQIQELERPPSVIMVTGMGNIEVAVDAMRHGAIDFLAKGQGYLDALPEVVLRAWRHHDLAHRAAELQRLALLVSGATDRDDVFQGIVQGAGRLLRATSCVLLLAQDDHFEPATVLGPRPVDLDAVRGMGLDEIVEVTSRPTEVGQLLLVPLLRTDGPTEGVLAVWRDGQDTSFTSGDVELAATFASFVGMALRNLRQRELEQHLVAELQQTVDARRDFIASISHELRTPLTCITGFAQTMRSYGDKLSDAQSSDFLTRILSNTSDLHALVDDLIDLAALDRGTVTAVALAPIDLDVEMRVAVADAGEILEDRLVTVEVPARVVMADPLLLRRTVANLLTNAVKFSGAGSAIAIRAVDVFGEVRVEVEDHGIGLEQREAARVFDPFFRAVGSVANAVRGSGIGLALVKEYVRTMGGSVGVVSEPGEGSTFWFTLRAAPAGSVPAPTVPATTSTAVRR